MNRSKSVSSNDGQPVSEPAPELPERVRAEVQRILQREARRLLQEDLEAQANRKPGDGARGVGDG